MMADPRFLNRNESFMNHSTKALNSDFAIALRKSKRKSFITKKRKEIFTSFEDYCLYIGDLPPQLLTRFPILSLGDSELSKLVSLKNILDLEELSEEDCLEILKVLGKSLISDSVFPRNLFLEFGVFETFIKIVKNSSFEGCVSEALCCLCNFAASKDEFSGEILKTGVLSKILEWVQKGGIKVKENGIWTLGNMLGGCEELAASLIEKNYLDLLLGVSIESDGIAEGVTLNLSNLTRDLSRISKNHIEVILTICEKIKKFGNFSYLWTLSNLTKGENWILDKIVLKTLADFAFEGILSVDRELYEPSALILCNFAGGSQAHSDFLLANQIFSLIFELFPRAEDDLLFLIFNLMRNIVVDNPNAATQLKNSNLLLVCIEGLSGRTMKVQKEACLFLLNLSYLLSSEDETFITKLLPYLCICLENLDNEIVQSSLNVVFNVLSLRRSSFLSISEEIGLVKSIEDLQQHPNDLISNSSSYILNEFL